MGPLSHLAMQIEALRWQDYNVAAWGRDISSPDSTRWAAPTDQRSQTVCTHPTDICAARRKRQITVAGRTKFNPRELMELAIEVMRRSESRSWSGRTGATSWTVRFYLPRWSPARKARGTLRNYPARNASSLPASRRSGWVSRILTQLPEWRQRTARVRRARGADSRPAGEMAQGQTSKRL